MNNIGRPVISFMAKKSRVKLDREKTVVIVGSAQHTKKNQAYLKIAEDLSCDLAKKGFNVVTGGGYGVMESANKGAWSINPKNSWAIYVKKWMDKHSPEIFNNYRTVKACTDRTELFNKIAKYWVVFPGGTGTLEELAVCTESKYYNNDDKSDLVPEKVIIVGKTFHKPLMEYFNNMKEWGLAKDPEKIYDIVETEQEIMEKITGTKLDKSL